MRKKQRGVATSASTQEREWLPCSGLRPHRRQDPRAEETRPKPHPPDRWGGDGLPAADYDGMAELWFDDLASLLAARASPEWAASTANEKNFADEKRVALFVAEEHRIL